MAEPIYYRPFSERDLDVVALCVAICKADAARLGMAEDAALLDDLWLRLQVGYEQVAPAVVRADFDPRGLPRLGSAR